MADNPPISTSVPETVTVDTGADKETVGSLNDSFADFWKEEDSKTDTVAPAAPGDDTDGAAQETKKEVAPELPLETRKVETKGEGPSVKDYSDEDIDKWALTKKGTGPEAIENFKQITSLWKADRAQMRAEAERAAKLENELAQARQNSWTPEQKADYEHAAGVRRRFDFVSDPEFIQRFHAPIQSQFEDLLEEAVEALPEKQAARNWADYIKANYRPDQLDRQWWLNSVVAKVPEGSEEKAGLRDNVFKLLKLQKDRDSEISKRTNDRASFDNWINEKATNTQKRVQEEIMTEIGVQEKRIQEVLPRNVDEAKTPEERRAIEKHNERFEQLNKHFKETVQDLSANGPRAWVRASVEATRSLILEEQLKSANDELKTAQTERDRYKSELDKIAGVRRKLSSTSGTPPTPAGTKGKGNNETLSIKDLDVRKSFDRYDWGDST
jgi:hypothetical protein